MVVRTLFVALGLLTALACRAKQETGQAPPALASVNSTASARICASALAEFEHPDLRGILPATVGEFCVDPNSSPRSYGHNGEGTMDEVCTELFNGECELYKSFGLSRVTTVRFVRNDGAPALVSANVSRFGGSEGALAFFSRRVLGDQDPKSVNLRPVDGLPYAALGTGVAYVQSGPLVVELVYVNEVESPSQIRTASDRLLPQFATLLRERENPPPKPVAMLPTEGRLPFGVFVEPRDGFGVKGLGAVATGYYEREGKRYRVSVSESADEAGAKQVYAAARRLPGRHLLKEAPFEAFEVRQVDEGDGPVVWWLIGKQGNRVVGVSDEPWAKHGKTPDEQAQVSYDRAGKFELMRQVFRGQ
jgi:hypothetical protein